MLAACIICPKVRQPGSVFCRKHERAPAGQRGGWLSAHARKLKMANGPEPLNASCIATRLWVGGAPPFDRDIPDFDVLVLCAADLQPDALAFHGRVVRCPLPDAALSSRELMAALQSGKTVADELVAGKRVLVTCSQGRNRSALVACLALGLVTEMTVRELVANVRARRDPMCLSNDHFLKILHRYVGNGRTVVPVGAFKPPATPKS